MAAVAFLSEVVDRLHFLVETQRLVNSAITDTDGVLATVAERARIATNADGVDVELVDGDELVTRACDGILGSPIGKRIPIQDTISGLCLRLGTPQQCRDVESDRRFAADERRDIGLRSVMVAPFVCAGKRVGVLKALSRKRDYFDGTDMDVLELMAGSIASSLSSSEGSDLEAHHALYDGLTGLANRTLLMDRLTQVIYDARRYGRPFGLFFIDLDGFRAINHTFGRDLGNTVLQAVSCGLSATVRTGDTLARLSGDEFIIVCQNADRTVEDRIRTRIDAVFGKVRDELKLEGFELTASIGAIWSAGEEASAESLITAATSAMYRARRERDTFAH